MSFHAGATHLLRMRPLTGSRPPQDLRDEELRKRNAFQLVETSINCSGVGDPKDGHPELSRRLLPMVRRREQDAALRHMSEDVSEFNHFF